MSGSIVRIDMDMSEPRGARVAGRVFLGSYSRVIVSGGTFAGITAGVTVSDDEGNDAIAFQALEQYGGGRTLAGDVLFSRSGLEHLLGGLASVQILVNVCDSDGNVYCGGYVTLHNSSGSAS